MQQNIKKKKKKKNAVGKLRLARQVCTKIVSGLFLHSAHVTIHAHAHGHAIYIYIYMYNMYIFMYRGGIKLHAKQFS